jgi:hypothetical protein
MKLQRIRKRREEPSENGGKSERNRGGRRRCIARRYNAGMPPRVRCDLCDMLVPPHAHYVVRIDVFADPSMPELSREELEEMDFDQTFRRLIEQMKHMSPQELQDQVHRRFEYKICPSCQRRYIKDPLAAK